MDIEVNQHVRNFIKLSRVEINLRLGLVKLIKISGGTYIICIKSHDYPTGIWTVWATRTPSTRYCSVYVSFQGSKIGTQYFSLHLHISQGRIQGRQSCCYLCNPCHEKHLINLWDWSTLCPIMRFTDTEQQNHCSTG